MPPTSDIKGAYDWLFAAAAPLITKRVTATSAKMQFLATDICRSSPF
jgi:hypothetical protein